jgi:hypothetical protein
MNDHPDGWRSEIRWFYVRRFLRAHIVMWMFGFILTLLSMFGLLVGGAFWGGDL